MPDTKEGLEAIVERLEGADTGLLADLRGRIGYAAVWSYADARRYRRLESLGLIRVGKPTSYRGDGTDAMPYFGAKLTASGRLALSRALQQGGGDA